MLPARTFNVTAMPHPLRNDQVHFPLGEGCSVEDAIVDAAERAQVDLRMFAGAAAIVEGTTIPKHMWAATYPNAGARVFIKVMPEKGIGSLLVTIGAFALGFIPGLQGMWLVAARIAFTVAGTLLVNALTPVPRQKIGGRADGDPVSSSIQGVRNEARPYGTIPKIYGRTVNYFPPLGALPYTEIFGDNEQYIRMIFVLGYGPLSITDLKIGDTPISQYRGVQYETRSGYSTDTPLTLYPNQVREEAFSIELRQVSGYSRRRTEPDTDEVSLDIIFPNGLQKIDEDNDKLSLEVSFEIRYREISSTTWLAAPLTYGTGVLYIGPFINPFTTAPAVSTTGVFSVSANTKAALRRSVRFQLPARGQYDVQIRRITQDDQSDSEGSHQHVTVEQSFWTAIRSIRTDPPIEMEGLAMIAMRIQASDQLNGIIEQFNCTVQAFLPVWHTATSSWVVQATRSPAWAFADVLRSEANHRPLDDSRIDVDALVEWGVISGDDDLTFDGIFTERRSVFEALQDIAATANASVAIPQGLYSVVVDEARTTVVQHFTPRNSRNFSSTKLFAHRPHALKVRFPNEETLHQIDEIIVYEDGYSATNATVFESIDLPYTTSASAAWKRARRMIFGARLRPEIYSLEVDIEHIACTRGDLVRVVHDVPLWGVGSARIKTLATSGANTTGVVLDAALPMSGGSSYSFRFRRSSGSTLVVPVNTVAGQTATFTFTTPVTTATGPQVGDLALFGEYGEESVELLVRSIEPRDDHSALMTFVDYAPEVFDADTGEIPEFDPQITLPPVVNRAKPPKPVITSITSDEAALIRSSANTFTSRILLGVSVNQLAGNVPAESLQARFRHAGTFEDYVWLSGIPASGGSVSIAPVEDRDTYEVQVRSVSHFGATSEWTTIAHTVIGKTSIPPNVDRMYRQGDLLTWPYTPPNDLAGFLLRANYGTSQDWGMARPLHQGVVTASTFDISALHGTQTILIKAVDTSGLQSALAASVTIDLGDMYIENIIETQSEAPGFTGTITGGTDTGSELEADLESTEIFWRADTALFWGADGDDFWPTDIYSAMTYTALYTPQSDHLNDGLIKVNVEATGDYTIDYRIQTSPDFWGADGDPFWGADGDLFWAADTIGEWTTFPGVLGPVDTTADSYAFRVTFPGGPVQGVLSEMDIIVDVPDIEELFPDFAVAVTTGTRLTLTKTYRQIDVINITREDDGVSTAVSVAYLDKQANPGAAGGPLIRAFNAAGAVVAATVDIRLKGH